MKQERKGHIMSKKILIQLLFVIAMIAYLAYYDFQILNVNGVIMTVIIGLWVLATVMMIMVERATQK